MPIIDLIRTEFPSATKAKDYRKYEFYTVVNEYFSLKIWKVLGGTFTLEFKFTPGITSRKESVSATKLTEELQSIKQTIREFCQKLLDTIGEVSEDS